MADVPFRTYLPYHYNSVETPIVVTDDTPTWTVVNTMIIGDNLPAGVYCLTLSWKWEMADINDSALFRVISPITTGESYRYEPNDVNERRIHTISTPETHLGGAITFQFEASKTVGAASLTIAESYFQFERKT